MVRFSSVIGQAYSQQDNTRQYDEKLVESIRKYKKKKILYITHGTLK